MLLSCGGCRVAVLVRDCHQLTSLWLVDQEEPAVGVAGCCCRILWCMPCAGHMSCAHLQPWLTSCLLQIEPPQHDQKKFEAGGWQAGQAAGAWSVQC